MPGDSNHVDEVLRHSRAVREEAGQTWSELRAAADQAKTALDLKGRMERNPYGTVLAAAGIGYVLGGGLFSRFTGQMLRLGLRVAVLPILRSQLEALGEAAMSGASAAEGYGGHEDGSGGL